MGKFARTWALLGASWRVLMQDKRLVVFPLISGFALLLLIILFFGPIVIDRIGQPPVPGAVAFPPRLWLAMFVFYFLDSCVIVFFNSALIACVFRQIEGGEPSLAYGLGFAWRRLPQILGWALLTATVGMLLRMLEQKVGFVGRLVVGMLGMAWAVTAFLVVPVLVAEGTGPIESYKRSVEMLKRTWGEQIIGNVSFSLIFGLCMFVPLFIVYALAQQHATATAWLAFGLLPVVWIALVVLVQSTLQTIYQAAIYLYAANGEAPAGFDGQVLAAAFRPKQPRGWL
ncbi:MAG: hypothetical protein EPN38_02180 [Rhodanobacteraceae bacterium]|nr:MAG: hypothetical protein EPN38_02180 [Rhodanobacteraceae bacterium]